MSEFIAEGLVDGQRVIMVKSVDGTIEQTNAFLAEVVVDDGSGHLQRCIAVKDLGGGSGGASALSDLSDVDLSGLEDGQCLIYDSESGKWVNGTIEVLPDQTGNAGKSLYTDGTNASWKVTRDPNTYRSLSSEQATTLLDNGTYNNEEVTSGEIFTCADGGIKQYEEENQGVGLDTLTFESAFYPCNTAVVEGNKTVLYATTSENSPNLLKSENGGKTWESVSSGRTSGTDKERIFHYDGTFYIIRSNQGAERVYLDVSSDNFQTWDTYEVAHTWGFGDPATFYFSKVNGHIIVGETYYGNAFVSDFANTPGTWTQTYPSSKVYAFNGMFVTNSEYSSDYGATWTSNGNQYVGPAFVANNKFYVQYRPSFGSNAELLESSNGTTFTNIGQYDSSVGVEAFNLADFSTYPNSDLVFGYAGGSVYYASITNGLLYWTKIADSWTNSTIYSVADNVIFGVGNGNSVRGEYTTIYLRSLNYLNGSVSGSSAPTDDVTVGYLGQIYVDKANKAAYICVESDSTVPTYTWKQITS